MGVPQSPPAEAERAITDVFDDQRRTFALRYPAWLIVALCLFGVVAFALVGFYGFRDSAPEPALVRSIFHEPWPLFLWFCALIMALQSSVLRNRLLRPQMVAALTVTIICMLIVGAAYYYGREIDQILQQLLRQLLNIRQFVPELGTNKYFYAFINFLILTIFWVDTIRRWIRGARGLPLNPAVDIGLSSSRHPKEDSDKLSMEELISGDLIAGAVLTLIMAVIFRAGIINFFSDALQVHVGINTCTVTWPFGPCTPPGATLRDAPTLSFIDLIQALIYLPLGLLVLAISATLSGMAAGEGVDTRLGHQPGTAHLFSEQDDGSTTRSVAEQVTLTLLNTLRSAISRRRAQMAVGNMALSLRNVIWPVLVLIGTISVATAARGIQNYLHLQSDIKTCSTPSCPDYSAVQHALTFGQPFLSMALALIWGLVAVMAVALSVALLIFSQRVAENTVKFLALIGFIALLTFWIFSLALSGFNELLWLAHATDRWPFPQPGPSTIISLACLLIFGLLVLARRVRHPAGDSTVRLRVPANVTRRTRAG